MSNDFKILSNIDKKNIGFWIRPDENLNSIHYDKLLLLSLCVGDNWSWQTEDKPFSYEELSTDMFVLNFREDIKSWTILNSSPKDIFVKPQIEGDFDKTELMSYDNSGFVTRKFMKRSVHSMIEERELFDISWSRIHDIDELLFENYKGEDIVWRLQKHWSHDGQYARSDSVEQTLWLSDYTELSDGTLQWTATGISSYEIPEECTTRYVEYIAGTITRPIATKPYQTCLWKADVPVFFDFPSSIAALHNAKQLCLSYIANNPLAIKYVIADAVPRDIFNQMIQKESDWNVYQHYIKGQERPLYDDSWPFFHDN